MSPKTPLLRPAAYFERTRSPLATGTAVFLAHVIVDSVLLYLVVYLILDRIEELPAGVQGEVLGMMMGILVFAAVIYVIAWFLVAAVMHFLSGGNDTAGSFSDALGVAGWAYTPELISAPILFGFIWTQIEQLDLSGDDPAAIAAEIEALEAGGLHPVAIIVALGVVAWSVYLLSKGVAATHDVSVEKTLPPALLVGAASLLLTLI